MKSSSSVEPSWISQTELTPSQYCSRECQKEHWSAHKLDCQNPYADSKWSPRWVLQQRSPAFITSQGGLALFGTCKYLWGNVPALDIINIDENEGTAYDKDIGLCFAGRIYHHFVECIVDHAISIRRYSKRGAERSRASKGLQLPCRCCDQRPRL